MPFAGPIMAADILQTLTAKGFAGSNSPSFANAIGNGCTLAMTGKPFNTIDQGSGSGAGAGFGQGLNGLVPTLVSQSIYQACVTKFGQAGDRLLDVTDAIASALVNQMPLATLVSSHFPVFAGTGNIIPGSIVISPSEWGAAVNQLGLASGFLGDEWGNFADAVGEGCSQSFSTVSGTVVISGAGTPSPVPPSPNTIIPAGVMS